MTQQSEEPVLCTRTATDPYMAMLNALPSPVYYADASYTYRFANEAYARWLGVDASEVKDEKIVDILGHATFERLSPYMQQALQGTKVCFEVHDLPYFPQPVTIECCYTPDFNEAGETVGFLAWITDVTEKRVQQQLLQERGDTLSHSLDTERSEKDRVLVERDQHYNRMISEVEDYAILSLDENGNIQNWNKGAENIKGYTEAEIIGKSFKVFYLPEDQQNGLPEKLLATAKREGRATHEGWRVRKDGSTFWGSILISALHDENGHVIGYTKVTRDLTERKKAEDQLRQNARELELQNKELEQFAYIASHDLKEPLRKILIYSNRVLELAEERLTPKEQDHLKRAIRSADRMGNLIDDVLAYSRTAMVHECFDVVNLGQLVNDLATHFLQEDDSPADLQVNIDPLPVINGIPYQLSQLFENLFTNSIKYRNPDRPLRISIEASVVNGPVHDLPASGAFHHIRFHDNGIGFENCFRERIFDLFQRLVTKDEYEGTGIGLAICKKIMQAHRGFIAANGEPGAGATFELFFPVN